MSTSTGLDQTLDRYNQVLCQIGSRLAGISLEFGPTDYPEDGGRSFWAYLYGFPYIYLDTMKYHLLEEPTDTWAVRNRDRALRLEISQLVRIAGASHFLVEARKFHGMPIQQCQPRLRNTLDWLSNTYDFDGYEPQMWFTIITRIADFQQFWSESLMLFFDEVAGALSVDKGDLSEASSWGGLASIADITLSSWVKDDVTAWSTLCNDHYRFFTE